MSRAAQKPDSSDFLYRELAFELANAIRAGALHVGDRIPSVRRLSAQYSVSISTAVQALRYLENQRLIEARPKSGFFVARPPRELPEPSPSRPPASARYVVTSAILREYIEALMDDHDAVRLGVLRPDVSMFPLERLGRLLGSVTRRNPALSVPYNTYDSGAEPLRRVIARRALECGVHIAAKDVVVTSGCLEAITLALRAVARPGATIALESPAYFPLFQNIETLGMKVLEVPTHPRTGMSVDAFDLATQKRGAVQALLLVPSYSNPLGSCMPEDSRRRLVALCAEREVPIIENDVYGELTFDGARPRPLKAWDESGSVLLCSSFNKAVAPGLQIGWIIAGRYQREVELLKLANTMFTPQPPQLALAEFMNNGGCEHHLRRLRATLKSNALKMRDAVAASFPSGSRISRPTGGYVLWIELPGGVDAIELFRRTRAAGVIIAPGPLFTTANRFHNCIRLSYAHAWTHEVEDAIACVARIARELSAAGQAAR